MKTLFKLQVYMDLLAQYSKAQGKSSAVKGDLCEIFFFSLLWKSV